MMDPAVLGSFIRCGGRPLLEVYTPGTPTGSFTNEVFLVAVS